jgi:MFS family permease
MAINEKTKNLLNGSNIWYMGEGMLGPLLAVFSERVGGDILDISIAWSIFLVLSGIISIIVGRLSDRFDKRKIMVAGYWLNAIMTFAYVFVSDPIHLFIVQAGLGIASALSTPTWDALIDEYSGKKQNGTVWGLAEGLPNIVTGVAIVVGGFLVTYQSFGVLFVVMGSIQVVAAIVQSRILFIK